MGSRKAPEPREGPAPDETVAAEPSPRICRRDLTTEERRQRILEGLPKLDEEGGLRVDWFIRAILEDDPVLMSLASAPEDDEPETEEERRAVEEAKKETGGIPHEEVRRLWLGDR